MFLKHAVLAMLFAGIAAVVFVFSRSLEPSARATALHSQYRFPAEHLEDLRPGEIRRTLAGGAPILVVVPDNRVAENIEAASQIAKYPEINTFDSDLNAYILWVYSPKARGPTCGLMETHQDGHNMWFADGLPEGFFDPCSGDRFDYAGRILVDANGRDVQNLRKPTFERIASDEYQITNVNFLMAGVPE